MRFFWSGSRAQVEVAVLEAELLVGLGVAYYLEGRGLRLGENAQLCYDYLNAAGLYLGVDALTRAHSTLSQQNILRAYALRLFEHALFGGLIENELNDTGLVSQIYEDKAALVADSLCESAYNDFSHFQRNFAA